MLRGILLLLLLLLLLLTAIGLSPGGSGYFTCTVDSGLHSALNLHTVRLFTESDDTRGCNNTICPPEDEQGTARNTLRIIM